MLTAQIIAKYFLSKDPERKLFNKKIVNKNTRISYEGNIRMNKYLFLSQVVYLAKYEKKLFLDDFVAYDNGPVVLNIVKEFPIMETKSEKVSIPPDIKNFLDKIYMALENATYEELIEITHEDPEWIKLKNNTHNAPIMNIEQNIEDYKKRYKGLIAALKI